MQSLAVGKPSSVLGGRNSSTLQLAAEEYLSLDDEEVVISQDTQDCQEIQIALCQKLKVHGSHLSPKKSS